MNLLQIARSAILALPAIIPHLTGRARWLAHTIKSYSEFSGGIEDAITGLHAGSITESLFVDYMAEIISTQLREAWLEGMAANDLAPDEMIDEWDQTIEAIILNEYEFVDRLAGDIVAVQDDEKALPGLISRGGLWANRYNDVVNLAKLRTSDGTAKFEWILGDSIESCETCPQLDGIVAFSREWEQSRFRPQEPPNDMIDCGGWNCHCRLEPTTKRRSQNALNRLINIATSRKV